MAECKLTEKQKLFCEEYVANGYKLQKAYMKAFPNASPGTATANASKLIKRQTIKDFVKQIQHDRFEALNINADRIAEELSKMAFADFDDNNNASTKQKALELLAKQLGLYTQKIDANVEGKTEITITIGSDDEELSSN